MASAVSDVLARAKALREKALGSIEAEEKQTSEPSTQPGVSAKRELPTPGRRPIKKEKKPSPKPTSNQAEGFKVWGGYKKGLRFRGLGVWVGGYIIVCV